MASRVVGSYCDVGGKPRRFVGYKPDHITMPIIDSDDVFRSLNVDPDDNTCRCRLPHMCDDCRGHSVYTLNDVLYHLKPSDIATLLAQDPTADFEDGKYVPSPRVFASVLNLSGHRGSFYFDADNKPETRWVRLADGRAAFYNKGAQVSYYHRVPDWLGHKTIRVPLGDRMFGLAWNVVSSNTTTTVYEFVLIAPALVAQTPRLANPFHTEFHGTVDVRGLAGTDRPTNGPEAAIRNVERAYAISAFQGDPNLGGLLLDCGSEPIFAPRSMIAVVATSVAGKPRTAKIVDAAYNTARRNRSRCNLTDEEFARALPYIVQLGLVSGLAAERVNQEAMRDYARIVDAHAEAVASPSSPGRSGRPCGDASRLLASPPRTAPFSSRRRPRLTLARLPSAWRLLSVWCWPFAGCRKPCPASKRRWRSARARLSAFPPLPGGSRLKPPVPPG